MISASTNTAALTAQRYLGQANSSVSSSIAKLSSGSRIVRASDDASALAISNKLRADISALQQASRNASQGASLLQVANGAMDRIGDILTRMKTLATQVVNGTLSNTERQYAQQEFSELVTQIDQISDQTRWNGQPLLNGGDKTLANPNPHPVNDQTGEVIGLTASGIYSTASIVGGTGATGTIDGYVEGAVRSVTVTEPFAGQYQIEVTIGTQSFRGFVTAGAPANSQVLMQSLANDHNSFVLVNPAGDYPVTGNAAAIQSDLRDLFNLSNPLVPEAYFQSNAATTTNVIGVFSQNAASIDDVIVANGAVRDGRYTVTSRSALNANGIDFDTILRVQNNLGEVFETRVEQTNIVPVGQETELRRVLFSNGLELVFERQQLASTTTLPAAEGPPIVAGNIGSDDFNGVQFDVTNGTATTIEFQVGENALDVISVGFISTTSEDLGLDVANIDTLAGGQAASVIIDTAITRINSATARIGAIQSRMEFVEANIATITENLTAAKGVFKDVDFAAEVTELTKQQLLNNAGISVLAQANQLPQQLLNLLQ